jgi:hypothetical protein
MSTPPSHQDSRGESRSKASSAVSRASFAMDTGTSHVDNTKEFLKYVMFFLTKSDRTAIFITLPRPLGLGFETLIFRP